MKIKDGFILKKIDGQNIICYEGQDKDSFNSVITLSEISAFLWSCLEKETSAKELLDLLLQKYDISTVLALNEIDSFTRAMKHYGIVE